MKKMLALIGTFSLLLICSMNLIAQVSTRYNLTVSETSYSPISGSTLTEFTPDLDNGYVVDSIPFTFNYNGTDYDHINITTNGAASFGSIESATPENQYLFNVYGGVPVRPRFQSRPNSGHVNGISEIPTPPMSNILAPWFNDLINDFPIVPSAVSARNKTINNFSKTSGASAPSIQVETLGESPNRVYVVQYTNYYDYFASISSSILNFQIRLYETSNQIEFIYGYSSGSVYDGDGASIGISGVHDFENSDFIDATTGSTTEGNSNVIDFPASGTKYTFALNPPQSLTSHVASTYTLSTLSGTYSSVVTDSSSLIEENSFEDTDDGYLTVNLPFTFSYDNVDYSDINISTNGDASFGSISGASYYNEILFLYDPSDDGGRVSQRNRISKSELKSKRSQRVSTISGISTNVQVNILAPWFNDLADRDSSRIDTVTTGESPNRIYTIQYSNYPDNYNSESSTSRLNFQIKLYETSNIIEFVYGDTVGPLYQGTGASVGICGVHNADSTDFIDATTGSTTEGNANVLEFPASGTIYRFNPGTTVPVELVGFSYSATDSKVTLNWQTKSETNNAGWEIQKTENRKPNTGDWKIVGFVSGKGTTTEQQSYQFTDNYSVTSSQYRLKQIDFNGASEFSSILTVSILPAELKLLGNYPNPFNPSTKIEFALPESGDVTLNIFNILGQKVATPFNGKLEAGVQSLPFNAAGLSSGVYIYQIKSGTQYLTGKLMLSK